MATSMLELGVGTGKWDAGLKKAKQSLDNFTQANGGLQQALEKESQKMQKFVQMMGQMDSTAKTAKGQMNDYKATIEQLTMQYNRMSEAQKKTIGQDYLNSIEQIKEKFRQTKTEMEGINKSLGDMKMPDVKSGGLFSGLGEKMSGMLQVFGGNMLTKAAGAVANLGSEMYGMVQQGVELARQGEGIRIAFERLGRGDILDGLRQATHGTVTDIELMKAAVKFNDFKLPLDELGTMLAFAQQKAKDTGQSVDYMVDSIVTGLGRKSLMILDNLGLSANEVKERMAETGDMTKAVGAIIREQMAKAGDYVETAADRAAQANVSLQNKMEELGRKFAPVEEASNQLWTSMKISILDIVGGPLARLLNGLTEAGRLRNQLNNMNGQEGSGNTKVDQQLKKLNVIRKGGGSDRYFNATLSGMVEDYNRQIMALDAQIKNGGKKPGAGSGESQSIRYLQEQMKALQIMRDQLKSGAKELSKPVDVKIETKGAEQNVESLKLKLIELEAQRKKAIAAGDTDLSENLAKQITQVKSDIKGLGGSTTNKTTTKTIKTDEQLNNDEIQKLTQEYIKASDDRRKAIEVEIRGLQDKNKEIARLKDMALGKIGDDGSLSAMTQQLKELQAAQAESASGREWDDYQKKIEDVMARINVLKGVLSKDQQATFTVEVNAEQLEQLRMLLPNSDDTIRVNVEEGSVNLPEIPKGDETIRVNVTATTADAMKEVRDMVGEIEGWQVAIEPKIEIKEEDLRTSFEKLQDSIRLELSEKNIEVDKNALKSLTEVVTQYDINTGSIDMSAIMAQTEELTNNGMSAGEAYAKALQDAVASNLDLSIIQQRIGEKIDIPDETWQALQDEINEKLKELGIEPIKIDFKTGKIDESGKTVEKSWQSAARAVQAVGSAMESIEDPAAKIAGTVAQAIANIALGYSQAMLAPKDPVSWIAFGAAGLAQMLAMMNAIHSSTGYANGGMVKGNSYSGDNIPALVDGSELVGLNAGEIVLNAAQSSNVAQGLQSSSRDVHVTGHISGENIILAANRTFKRKGQGEIVTW